MLKLGLDINIDKISWNILDRENKIKDCGSYVFDISSEDKEDFLRGEKVKSYTLRHRIRKRRGQYRSYKYRRERLIKKLVELEFCHYDILNRKLKRKQIFELRERAQRQEITNEEFALICIHFSKNRGYSHNRITDSSSVLRKIENQDKELFDSNKTLSKFLLDILEEGEHKSIKEYIFTRERHREDFNIIFQIQSKYKKKFTPKLCFELRDRIIFYQKKFSFSNQIYNDCPFEKFHKNTHISNPFFLDFIIWKQLSKLIVYDKKGVEYILDTSTKKKLFEFLKNKNEVSGKEILLELERIGDLKEASTWLINKDIIKGNFLRFEIEKILKESKISENTIQSITYLDYKNNNLDSQPLFDIWHSIYSIYDMEGIENKLINKYNLPVDAVRKIVEIRLNEKTHYGYLSTKACRKLIIEMQDGFMYSMACKKLGYFNYDKVNLSKSIKKETPLHRVVINRLILILEKLKDNYKFDEINILIDKNLTISKEMRKSRIDYIINLREQRKINIGILKKKYKVGYISGKDIEKYNLWKEVGEYDLISMKKIDEKDIFSENYIIKDLLGNDETFFHSNKVLLNKDYNVNYNKSFVNRVIDKEFYIDFLNKNLKNNMNTEKYLKYLGIDMRLDFNKLSFFEERVKILLRKYSDKINIIDFKEILKVFKLGKGIFVSSLRKLEYSRFIESKEDSFIEEILDINANKVKRLKKWKKVEDVRYFILRSIIANSIVDLNNISINDLNYYIQEKMCTVLIYSEKKDNIIFSKTKNPVKQLHRDINYGKIKKKLKIDLSIKIDRDIIDRICDYDLRITILKHLEKYNFNFKKGFSKKELSNNPIFFNEKKVESFYIWEDIFVTKKEVNKYLPFDKIVDNKLGENIKNFIKINGDGQLKKGIKIDNNCVIKSVRVKDIANDLHNLKQKSYVYLRDNHHISIFRDKKGKLIPIKVTYWDVLRKKVNNENYLFDFYDEDTLFVCTLKINDYLLFTDKDVDFTNYDIENKKYIGDNLFRVQKLTIKSSGQPYFWFRHHKENTINNDNPLSVKIISSLNNFKGYKLDIDPLGKIVGFLKIE